MHALVIIYLKMHITKLHITFDSEALLLKHILNALCNGFLAMSTKDFVNYIHALSAVEVEIL